MFFYTILIYAFLSIFLFTVCLGIRAESHSQNEFVQTVHLYECARAHASVFRSECDLQNMTKKYFSHSHTHTRIHSYNQRKHLLYLYRRLRLSHRNQLIVNPTRAAKNDDILHRKIMRQAHGTHIQSLDSFVESNERSNERKKKTSFTHRKSSECEAHIFKTTAQDKNTHIYAYTLHTNNTVTNTHEIRN